MSHPSRHTNHTPRTAQRAFTYIELLITLAVIAVLFVPIMQLFSQSLYATNASRDLITATTLAQWQMERLKNLNLKEAALSKQGNMIHPAGDEEPLKMNGALWRIETLMTPESDPLEIRVAVFHDGVPEKPIVTLVTLIEDMTWVELRPV